nr:hypothetical protein [Tanacetum cinerariifolium]
MTTLGKSRMELYMMNRPHGRMILDFVEKGYLNSIESLNSNSQERERELHQLKLMQDKAKESCMESFRLLHSLLKALLIQHMESLRESILERAKHKRENDIRVNDRTMQSKKRKVAASKALDAGLIVTECSGTKSDKQDTSSSSGNDITHAMHLDIKPNDQVPFAEVQLIAQHNVLANTQQHSVQSEPIYDTHLLEKVDRNTTLDLTNMCHRGGEIDQNAEKCQVSCPLLDPSFDNMTTEFSNQSLEFENISLKKTIAQIQKDFSRMEAHCVDMELKYQNQDLKDGQHGQILNETSNKAKIKKEIKVLEMINTELEHSVAKLLAENEMLHKENEHLKQTYKDLYDFIKKTRVQTKDHNDSLIAQINSKTVENGNLKAQIQKKVFANVALQNELRKLKGNSGDTKLELALHVMTPATISLGLVPNPPPSTPFVPPSRTDWDLLFQPLLDELLNPPSSVDHPAPKVIALIIEAVAPELAASASSPSSTTVHQDAPSASNSQTSPKTQSPVISNDVVEENHDLDVAYMNNDPFFGISISEMILKHLLLWMLFPPLCTLLLLTQNTLPNGLRIIL